MLARVEPARLGAALSAAGTPAQAPIAARNAFNALRRHRDPASVLFRPQYRPALGLVAVAVSDECLEACVEQLGDHADDPTKAQLLEALDVLEGDFPRTIVAVMLASVADSEMPASDLCFEILTTDERFGFTGDDGEPLDEAGTSAVPPVGSTLGTDDPDDSAAGDSAIGDSSTDAASATASAERREERRLRRRRDAEARRKRSDAERRSAEQARRARHRRPEAPPLDARSAAAPPATTKAPRLRRRAVLTPVEEREFDRDDPWSGAVVFAWVPFTDDVQGGAEPDPEGAGSDGKSRRCVVVAGSPDHLLVRAGYSKGGSMSRDWKAVEVRGWRRAGFDQPTWIDSESIRVERDADMTPVGWLSPDDWNALW